MSHEELINKKFKESVQGIDERILSNQDEWYAYVINLPVHLRIVYTIVILHQQVFNGGFHQYFFNRYGLFGYMTLDSLKAINAGSTMNLLKKVLEKVNDDDLEITEFKNRVFNKKIDKIVDFDDNLIDFLEECDDKYYKVEEGLTELLGNYLERVQ